jgi:hypothetical protein
LVGVFAVERRTQDLTVGEHDSDVVLGLWGERYAFHLRASLLPNAHHLLVRDIRILLRHPPLIEHKHTIRPAHDKPSRVRRQTCAHKPFYGRTDEPNVLTVRVEDQVESFVVLDNQITVVQPGVAGVVL